ncbi:MAG: proline dehydrogenase family protein [Thermodesulfobacteriota bacterium]
MNQSGEENRLVEEAIDLAARWQERANQLLTSEERGIQEQMVRLLTHPMDKVVLTRMIDQSFRSEDAGRVADQISHLLQEYGVPDFFSSVEKLLVQMFLSVGRHIPNFTVPKVIGKMRHDSSRAIIPGEPDVLHAHLRKRKKQGVRMNINHLGEAVLGEAEALSRLATYADDLRNPEIEYISVKISTIYSQIQSLAFDHTIAVLKERLGLLYQTARENRFIRPNGTAVPKFVNLDMEEYRDLEITAAAFLATLEEPQFRDHSAGIVLQAYLPDSHAMQQTITAWAKKRVAAGGSPIRIRIVKGANMEMEMVEAAIQNWPLATYDRKLLVDANYKRMVHFGMRPENCAAVHLGIASHNLFELAYAFVLARQNNLEGCFSFEMLEGMADHIRRAICETTEGMVMYAPVATREQFISAIAYLIRRLDENTAPENFLRYAAGLKTGTKEWDFLKEQFAQSVAFRDKPTSSPYRIQNRLTESFPEEMGPLHYRRFENEPDTDWSLSGNRKWAEGIRETWKKNPGASPLDIPLVIGGREIMADRRIRECLDPSQLPEKVCIARFALANDDDIEQAVATAGHDPDGWRRMAPAERRRLMAKAAMALRKARGDLIGAAMANTGKVMTEADVEVSEAVDFVEYYPYSADALVRRDGVRGTGRGVGLVIAPWNFPIAIPCGGIAAALAAGNTVLFKPSSDAVLVAHRLCRCFWDAGISGNVLQFLPCEGPGAGARLAQHRDVDFIIFTGGTDTGLGLLRGNPAAYLAAETGGKNATIVTAMSDRDQAIKNVVHSAFSNSGQKCSATSLLILEKEVYEDGKFAEQLADAARSMKTGSVWRFENKIGPLIRPPGTDLLRALTTLEPGESWLLQPENIHDNPHLWTPGIKWGVRPGSHTHRTEFFGPLLGVMCAENLAQAVALANQTGYGLTSGLESLDEREQRFWEAGIEAGNLYINRGTTGAMVLRQPFGGMKKSAIGAGIKAGGPNYVAQFMHISDDGFPAVGPIRTDGPLLRLAADWRRKNHWGQFPGQREDLRKTLHAVESYLFWMEQEFGQTTDYFHLRGQDNFIRYLPAGRVMVRLHPDDSFFDALARIAAARISGCRTFISVPAGMHNATTRFLESHEGRRLTEGSALHVQTDAEVAARLSEVDRIRYAAPERVPVAVSAAAAAAGFYIARAPVRMDGRIELIHYFREQCVCRNYHRYGNLGERGM